MESSNVQGTVQKLLFCKVVSKDFGQSKRFVELENFQLWAYMMFHKHGLRIQDISLWLWVCENKLQEYQELYEQMPDILQVSKIGVFLSDELNGFSHVIYRYSEEDQVSAMKKILMSHVSPELISSGNCELVVEQGYCIKNDIKNLGKMVLGLSENDTSIWACGN